MQQDTGEGTSAGMGMSRSLAAEAEVRGNLTLLPAWRGRKNPAGRRMAARFIVKNP